MFLADFLSLGSRGTYHLKMISMSQIKLDKVAYLDAASESYPQGLFWLSWFQLSLNLCVQDK